MCNLEGCITDSDKPAEKIGPIVKAPAETLCALKKLGISAATLANTHTFDFGKKGHEDMCEALEKFGIEYFGTGNDIDSIKTHITVEIRGIKVTLYTVTEVFDFNAPEAGRGGANPYDEYAVCNELRQLKESCDCLIVLYHGGSEMTRYITTGLRKRFHRMADNGADIVISQHTHAVGFEEHYSGAYLLYGQGNFCFNLGKTVNEFTDTGLVIEIIFSDGGYEIKKHIVHKTDMGCIYDEKQDMTVFEKLTELNGRIVSGDSEAVKIFEEEYSKYSQDVWLPRLMRAFRGESQEDDEALADITPREAAKYLASKYSKRRLMTIRMMLENDEFNEIALDFIKQMIKSKE